MCITGKFFNIVKYLVPKTVRKSFHLLETIDLVTLNQTIIINKSQFQGLIS